MEVDRFLRVIVSSEHELPFVRMNLREARGQVSTVLICEANRTHTGEVRQLIFERLLDSLPLEERSLATYVPMDLASATKPYDGTSHTLHYNEQKIRNAFAELFPLRPRDMVIAVDADEIVNSTAYKKIDPILGSKYLRRDRIRLTMRQFIYRMNWLWTDFLWDAVTACRAEAMLDNSRAQWRYSGRVVTDDFGAHFSWVMSPEQMVAKIHRYSHQVENARYADPVVLSRAVEDREYIFEPDRPFNLRTLRRSDWATPRSVSLMETTNPELFSREWWS